jgi:hypothetical protein
VAEANGLDATDCVWASRLTETVTSPVEGVPETEADTAMPPLSLTVAGDQLLESLTLSSAVCSVSRRDLTLP